MIGKLFLCPARNVVRDCDVINEVQAAEYAAGHNCNSFESLAKDLAGNFPSYFHTTTTQAIHY